MLVAIFVVLVLIALRIYFRSFGDFPVYTGPPLSAKDSEHDALDEQTFWGLIQVSRERGGGRYETQIPALSEVLRALEPQEIVRFAKTFSVLLTESYDYRLWRAAFTLNGGCSDDCFHYFRSWLIAQGRNEFYWAARFPRVLFFFAKKESIENYEGLEYCAREAYERKTNERMPDLGLPVRAPRGQIFSETGALFWYPELALFVW